MALINLWPPEGQQAVTGAGGFAVPVIFLLLCLSGSHYFVPALKKISLGPRWYSWMLDNRLHSIVISSYLWGWLHFLPVATVTKWVNRLQPFDRVFQVGTIIVQLSSVLMLFNQSLCIAILVAFTVFNFTIAVLSGIFFWQWMAVNILLTWAVWTMPPEVSAQLFGLYNGLLAMGILFLFPRRKKSGHR